MGAPAYSWAKPEPPATAPLAARAAAFGVDLVLVAGATFVAWKAAGITGFLPEAGFLGDYGFLLVAELPIGLLYFSLLEGFGGRTVGKMMTGVRVLDFDPKDPSREPSPPSPFQALLRNLLRFLWVTPVGPIFILVDLWLVWTGEMDQRLGDLAAGTIVVDAKAHGPS